jgi:2-(1,2-epoxy-1,2-dihydrophenyl)acetyl-CoA isomerase
MTEIDTGTSDLIGRVDQGVGVLTMNRPDRRNALSGAMTAAIARVLAQFEVDDDVGCVVLTGAGGAFCAGGDVKAMAENPQSDGRGAGRAETRRATIDESIHLQRLNQRATSGRLYEMPKPTVAALPGAAAGAGLSLALACDLRYASESAVLTTAFSRVGFAGDYGGTWFLTHLVGPAKARELYYLSPRITGAEAERLGIVNAVFADDRLEDEVMGIASRLAAGPRVAYRYMKENLNRAVLGELGECLDMEAAHHIRTGLTEDHREAVAAFLDKREPVFRGR